MMTIEDARNALSDKASEEEAQTLQTIVNNTTKVVVTGDAYLTELSKTGKRFNLEQLIHDADVEAWDTPEMHQMLKQYALMHVISGVTSYDSVRALGFLHQRTVNEELRKVRDQEEVES